MNKAIAISLTFFLFFAQSCTLKFSKNYYQGFDRDDFKNSQEYQEYRSSDGIFPQYIVILEVPSYEETIKASNPGEASAIRAYLLRKYNIETERASFPKLITPTEN